MDDMAVRVCSLQEKYPFMRLVDEAGGIVCLIKQLQSNELESADVHRYLSCIGDVSQSYPHIVDDFGQSIEGGLAPTGSAASADPEEALVCSIAEALERYASLVYLDTEIVVASPEELGAEAMDLETIPRCSPAELADPLCSIRSYDRASPMRWVRGYSLTHNRLQYIPLVMSHLVTHRWANEKFWLPISTGVAAHTDYYQAIFSGICEVIERDALALTWLARLPLPRILVDDTLHRRPGSIRQLFFDATTDLGIPSVYSVQLAENHHLAQFVSCATHEDALVACRKTMRESANARIMFEGGASIPDDIRDFSRLEHGAAYMGRRENRAGFDFLLNSRSAIPVSDLKSNLPTDGRAKLNEVVRRCKSLGIEILLVDLTTDDLRSAGLHVVRAIMPQLMPLPYVHRARFLGHPRLYQYPPSAGYKPIAEQDINPYPQPFA